MRNAPSAGSFPLKTASSMLKTAGCCRKTDACARNWPGSAPDPALKRGVDGAPHKMAAGWAVCFSTAPYGLRSFFSGTPLLVLADNGNSPFSIPLRGKATEPTWLSLSVSIPLRGKVPRRNGRPDHGRLPYGCSRDIAHGVWKKAVP